MRLKLFLYEHIATRRSRFPAVGVDSWRHANEVTHGLILKGIHDGELPEQHATMLHVFAVKDGAAGV